MRSWSSDPTLTNRNVWCDYPSRLDWCRQILQSPTVPGHRYVLGINAEDAPNTSVAAPELGRGVTFDWPAGGHPKIAIDHVTYPPPTPRGSDPISTWANLRDQSYNGGSTPIPAWTLDKPIAATWRLRPIVPVAATASVQCCYTFYDQLSKVWYELALDVVSTGDGQPGPLLVYVQPDSGPGWTQKFAIFDLACLGFRPVNGEVFVDRLDLSAFARLAVSTRPDKLPPPADWSQVVLAVVSAGVETYGPHKASVEILEMRVTDEACSLPAVVAGPLVTSVVPPLTLPSEGFEMVFGGHPDLALDVVAIGPTVLEWEDQVREVPAGGLATYRPAQLWPGYTAQDYRADIVAGRRWALVTVRGMAWAMARIDAPGAGPVYPRSVTKIGG